MSSDKQLSNLNDIQNCIFTIRGLEVMLDSDLAELYGVSAKRLNEQVKRNNERFPKEYRFQLTNEEFLNLESKNAIPAMRSQFATSNNESDFLGLQNVTLKSNRGGRRYKPYVFTEQGVSMLSAVLHSETAIKISIQIINTFVEMRKFISANAGIFQRLEKVEKKQLETDENFERLFKALEDKSIKPKQGIFYDGQIFDAYVFVSDLVKSAKNSIILIDNFLDESVLQLFTKRNKNVSVNIYTKNFTKTLQQDLKKYNSQYPQISITVFTKAHDRFLIIDDRITYHFGASLKDLGKKWFAFSKMDSFTLEILKQVKSVVK